MFAIADGAPSFAGMYLDEQRRLVILVADSTEGGRALAAINREAHRFSSDLTRHAVLFRHAKYSLSELGRWRDLVTEQRDLLDGVISIDLDERNNVVALGIDRANYALRVGTVRQLLKDLGIPEDAFRLAAQAHASSASGVSGRRRSLFSIGTTLRDSSTSDLAAGQGIRRTGSGSICTVGVVLDSASVRQFGTASHCTAVKWSLSSASSFTIGEDGSGLSIGTESADPAATGVHGINAARRSDAATVNVTGAGVTAWRGRILRTTAMQVFNCMNACNIAVNSTHPWFATTSEFRGSPVTGYYLSKVGRTTGWTEADLSQTCTDVYTDKWYNCQEVVHAWAGSGDSGGPVFYRTGTDAVQFYGILHGVTIDTTDFDGTEYGSHYYYSSLNNIESDFGFTWHVTTTTQVGTPSVTAGILSSHAYLSGYGVIVDDSPDPATYYIWRQLYNGPTATVTEDWTVVGTTTGSSTSFTDSSIGVLRDSSFVGGSWVQNYPTTTNPGTNKSTARYYVTAASFGVSSAGSSSIWYYKISNGN
ncbi:MAG: hypothetical protein JWO05_1136 [Gemmatimonadetes bacterium]|nr:hypothetical protein [Gemmatimonadota bacterium]